MFSAARRAWRSGISGSLLDRIDRHVEVPALSLQIQLNEPIEEGPSDLGHGEGISSDRVFRALRDKSQKRRHEAS